MSALNDNNSRSPEAVAEQVGDRLKQARLNANMTQQDVADQAGVSRRTVQNAEKGKTQLVALIAIMDALGHLEQLDHFLPAQELSPLQLAKLQGQQRQRASRRSSNELDDVKPSISEGGAGYEHEEDDAW